MILTCPSCGTRYRADAANFSPPGRNVRCAKCGHIWFQPSPEAEAPPIPESTATAGYLPAPGASQGQAGAGRNFGSASAEAGDRHEAYRNRVLQILGIILLLILLAGIGWMAQRYRQTVVRLWPESSRVYSAVGLPVSVGSIAIRNIGLRKESQDGTPVLAVTGRLVNVSGRDQAIPRLLAVLADRSHRELYRWTFDPGVTSLAPGAERDFGTTLPNPPPDAQTVNVNLAADAEDGR
jgi:predicted Zn finger-like uncharacterized protein